MAALNTPLHHQGDQKIGKNTQILEKVAKTVAQNCQNIYIKAQFESPKHLHKTTFET